MIELLIIWLAMLCILLFSIRGQGQGGALTLAYFLSLSLIHVPGVLAATYSEARFIRLEETRVGFEMTLYGMAAFNVGAIVARWSNGRGAGAQALTLPQARVFDQLGWRALSLGVIAYFVLMPVSAVVPSLTAAISALGTLLILGLWLRLYGVVIARDRMRMLGTLAMLPLLPLATLVSGGFIGYGICWIISIVAFLFVLARRRLWFYLAAPLGLYLGLSLFVTYMGQRTDLRGVLWHERSGLVERLEHTSKIVTDFQLLDLDNTKHIFALDTRLNQNVLVGAGILRHETGYVDLAYGNTVPWWLLIPRAIWPDKPAVGGGADLVTSFTGRTFAEGTSVGVGQVLEFYMNFGLPGVLIGFAVLGFALIWLDHRIMGALGRGDMRRLLLFAMPGLTLLQPGGNLLEIMVAALAAYGAAHMIFSLRLFQVGRTIAPATRLELRSQRLERPRA